MIWIGLLAVVAASACVAFLPPPRLSRAAWTFLGLLAAHTAWIALSILWSWAPDRTWGDLNRGAVYLAFAVLGLYLVRLGIERLGIALGVYVGIVGSWALLSKFVDDELDRVDRLREPIGYWNVLAFVLVLGLPLALRLRRDLAALAVYGLALAILLTYSRGGIVAGLVAIGVYAALARPPVLQTAAVVAAGVAPAALVFATESDGLVFALLLVLGAAAAYALIRLAPVRALARLAGAVAAAGAVAFIVAVGNPLDEFRNEPTEQRPGTEILTATSNNRWTWWGEALESWRDHPVGGTGAGSFELVHRQLRENELHARDPHSLPVAALSETGLVGLVLLGGAVAAAIVAARRTLRRLNGTAAALAAGGAAYLVHSLVDLHWEYTAATAPVVLVAGALCVVTTQREEGPRGFGFFRAAAAFLAAGGLLYSLAAPALAEWRTETARERIAAKDYAGAVDAAESASDLNPVAVEPMFALALAEDLRGNDERAFDVYEDAIVQQPENWRTWYELGVFEYLSLRELDAAFLDLDKAYALDPRNVAVQRMLDSVRDRLNAGG